MVRVHLDAVEAPRKGRIRPAGIPVVSVGYRQGVVATRLAGAERDLPDPVAVSRGVFDTGLERDLVAEPEPIDVGLEVLGDLASKPPGKGGSGQRGSQWCPLAPARAS